MKNNHFLVNILTILLFFACSGIVYSQPVMWYRTWGLPGYNRGEEGKRVCQTFDGGYAVMSIVSRGGELWFDLLKYNKFGNLLWANVIIDSIVTNRQLADMQQTLDSGFIFAGFLPAGEGALLVKTDKFGILKWQRSYPDLNPGTRFYNVTQTRDNGYIACGSYTDYINPSEKGLVIKVDSLGYVQWEKWYMDSTFNGYSGIIQGLDRSYYIAGGTYNNQRPEYSMLKKLDTLGNVTSTIIFYQESYLGYILQIKDSSLIAGGEDKTTNTNYPLIAKFTPSGTIKWIKTYPSPPPNKFYFYYMSKDLFENIIITGLYNKYTYSTILNWKLDTGGTVLKAKEVDFTGYTFMGALCINSTNDSGYILTGQINLSGNNDALTIKTDSAFNSPIITGIENSHNMIPNNFKVFQNHPNPFNSSTLVRFSIPKNGFTIFEIYDLVGKKVFFQNKYFHTGLNEYFIDFNKINISSGLYFARVNFDSESKLIKLVYLK